jgi:hypothetical protein
MPAESTYGTLLRSMIKARELSARTVAWNSNKLLMTMGPVRRRMRCPALDPVESSIRRGSVALRDNIEPAGEKYYRTVNFGRGCAGPAGVGQATSC